jgi:hypothetical protein
VQSAGFNIGEDSAQRATGYGSGLIRPNHQSQFTTAVAPLFDGLVAPSDNQKALRLDCDFFRFRHDWFA